VTAAATVRRIVNMTAITVVEANRRRTAHGEDRQGGGFRHQIKP
jgi:hypothetical protein